MDTYPVGQPVFLEIEGIKNNLGVLANPTALDLVIRKPDGSFVTKAIGDLTHVSTGHYLYVYVSVAGEEGSYAFRYDATNPTAVGEGVFSVLPSALLGDDAIVPRSGPCQPWTDSEAMLDGWTTDASDGMIDAAAHAASDAMFQLGGSRWPGVCDDVVEFLVDHGCLVPLPEGGVVSFRSLSTFGPIGRTVELPGQPVVSVTEVKVDGDVLDPSAYIVRDWRELVRVDGGTWPVGRSTDATPRLRVAYSFGQAPPALGRLGATALARELVLALSNDDDCRLDRRVQTAVREQVTMDFAIPGLAESLRDGQTGIPEVDLFVHAHNPNHLRREARLLMGDGPQASRRT